MEKKIQKREIFTREISREEDSRKIRGYAIVFGEESGIMYQDEDNEIREVIDPASVDEKFLDEQDIKMTMFHDRQLILARSNHGQGTLSYGVDKHGVFFEFEAPHTVDGDKALELVSRGDIAGCSFAFYCPYMDREYVDKKTEQRDGKTVTIYTVKRMSAIDDFTLAADPAYPATSVEARELTEMLLREDEEEKKEPEGEENPEEGEDKEPSEEDKEKEKRMKAQLEEMKVAAETSII